MAAARFFKSYLADSQPINIHAEQSCLPGARRHDLDDLPCLKGTELVTTRQHPTFNICKESLSD